MSGPSRLQVRLTLAWLGTIRPLPWARELIAYLTQEVAVGHRHDAHRKPGSDARGKAFLQGSRECLRPAADAEPDPVLFLAARRATGGIDRRCGAIDDRDRDLLAARACRRRNRLPLRRCGGGAERAGGYRVIKTRLGLAAALTKSSVRDVALPPERGHGFARSSDSPPNSLLCQPPAFSRLQFAAELLSRPHLGAR